MKHIKSERGQSLVELAISILILLYLLAGAVEFGLEGLGLRRWRSVSKHWALGSVEVQYNEEPDECKQDELIDKMV